MGQRDELAKRFLRQPVQSERRTCHSTESMAYNFQGLPPPMHSFLLAENKIPELYYWHWGHVCWKGWLLDNVDPFHMKA